MSRPMIRIHNLEDDTIIDREMNNEEFARHQDFIEDGIKAKQELEEKEAKRQSALAKLAALGLTEEEIAAL